MTGRPTGRSEGLIVEHLDGELLVYDIERNEAHALSGPGAAEFAAASDDVSRREALRRLALAGAAAAGGGALLRTVVAPTPADAQSAPCSCPGSPSGVCAAGQGCLNSTCLNCDVVTGQTCNFQNGCVCCNGTGNCTASVIQNGAVC
jgi:hypothetical protein